MLASLYRYRGFIWRHAIADMRHRYAGTSMGVVWNVLHPLAIIAVYSVVFSQIMHPPSISGPGGRTSYLLYLCSGFLPWLAFSECLTRGCMAFSENAAYLKKLPIPEQVFIAQTACSATLGLAISFSLLVVISLLLGLQPTWHWLLLPLPLLSLQIIGFGIGLMFGTLNVFFRDVSQFLNVGMQLLVWTVPVVYVADILPAWVRQLVPFHPVAPALFATRDLFLHRTIPDTTIWIAMAAWPVLSLGIGFLVFHPLRAEIRDNI